MTDDLFDGPGEDTGGVARDRWGRYLLPDPTASTRGKPQPYTRATTFAGSVADTYTLGQWQRRMVAKGLTLAPELYALAAATPLEDRDTLNGVCDDASKVAGSSSRATLGTAMHAFTEGYDRSALAGAPPPHVPVQWQPELAAYAKLTTTLGLRWMEIERIVVVPEYGVAGTFDRIGVLTKPLQVLMPGQGMVSLAASQKIIVDLKTGRDLAYSWHEIAIQLALYAHGFGMWNPGRGAYDRMPADLHQDVALVIHLPIRDNEHEPAQATLYGVDIREGWRAADLCRQVRVWRKVKGLNALVVSGVQEPVPVQGDPVSVFEEIMAQAESAVPVRTIDRMLTAEELVHHLGDAHGYVPEPFPGEPAAGFRGRMADAHYAMHPNSEPYGTTPHMHSAMDRPADGRAAPGPRLVPDGSGTSLRAAPVRRRKKAAPVDVCGKGTGPKPDEWCSLEPKHAGECGQIDRTTAPGTDPRSVEIARDMVYGAVRTAWAPIEEAILDEQVLIETPKVPYCAACDTDTHRCDGCGESVEHPGGSCFQCDERSAAEQTQQNIRDARVPATVPERIAAATSRADLSALYREQAGRGLWTPALMELSRARLAELKD